MRQSSSMSAQSVGERYLETVPLERRRAGGQVYTPAYLADFVLEQAGFSGASGETLLDPACGAGVFLERAVAILAARLRSEHVELNTLEGYRALADAVESALFGVDIEDDACDMTRTAVQRALCAHTGISPSPAFFGANVVRRDFLFSESIGRMAPARTGFRFVVGNPPYVTTTRLDSGYKDRLRSTFETAVGRLDLYAVFMERSLKLLAPGGRLALLTPDKFLLSQSARRLRALLLHGNAIQTVARFRSHKVFNDAATVPCVTVIERGGRSRNVAVLSCGGRPDASGRVPIVERRKVEQRTLSSGPWNLHALDRHELARKLQGAHPPLAHVTVRISAGPATGCDKVFVFPRNAHPEIEPSLLRAAVRGRDLEAYRITDPKLDALVPYVFDESGRSKLIDIDSFPGARNYLQRHRPALLARHCVRVWGKPWYDLHDQMPLDLARQPKILVPDVANSNQFVVDRGRYLPLHSVYYLIPKRGVDPDYLCAILNSRVAEFLVKLYSPVVKDGFNRYRQQFLATLPVPLASTDQALAIASAVREGRFDELDARIAHIFGLTIEEYHSLDATSLADEDDR